MPEPPHLAASKIKPPRRYQLSPKCGSRCSLNPANMPGTTGSLLHSWFEAGDNNPTIIRKAEALGKKLTNGSVGRHRANHLVWWDPANDPLVTGEEKPRKGDLEILDLIIARGADQVDLSTMRISAEQLLRAIELKQKLTQGSVYQDFFDAIGVAGDELAGQPEAPAAAASVEEQAQAAPDAD